MSLDPFCVEEELRRTRYYKSDYFNVLYDIKPVIPGHSLIVPKRHVSDFVLLEREEMLDLQSTSRKVIPKLVEMYGQEGSYDLTMQVGRYSGMTINHLHFHLLPRHGGDRFQAEGARIYSDIDKVSPSAMDDIDREVAKLRKVFKYEG